nr:nucleotidyl transferase AbiEii/AbiGii toxin family protein [Arcanobacterium pluranimalium]
MLEVGHDEIGDAQAPDWIQVSDIAAIFDKIGILVPGRIAVMSLDHQIAQKLHASSSRGDRARDLVDLQLILNRSEIDLVVTRKTCERLSAYRRAQTWPPEIIKQPGWESLYMEHAEGMSVAQTLDEAIEWVNLLIDRINNAH